MRISALFSLIILAVFLLAPSGCGETPISTRSIEEIGLDDGHANRMMAYASKLYSMGRFREALAAYGAAERSAWTETLRASARRHRIYTERVIGSLEKGQTPPEPPKPTWQIKEEKKKAQALAEGRPYETGRGTFFARPDKDLPPKAQGLAKTPGREELPPGARKGSLPPLVPLEKKAPSIQELPLAGSLDPFMK